MKNDKQLSVAISLGIEFVSAIVVGVFMGIWLDKYFHKSPLFMIVFFLLGCASGYINIIRYAQKAKNEDRK